MPYSIPLIPNRQAVGQVTYQLRRFAKQVHEMNIPGEFKEALIEDICAFEGKLKHAFIDFDDDGEILESEGNSILLGKDIRDKRIDELTQEIQGLEALRPHWAKGFSSDSVAAQTQAVALSQIWEALGVKDQTSALMKLKESFPISALDVQQALKKIDNATYPVQHCRDIANTLNMIVKRDRHCDACSAKALAMVCQSCDSVQGE